MSPDSFPLERCQIQSHRETVDHNHFGDSFSASGSTVVAGVCIIHEPRSRGKGKSMTGQLRPLDMRRDCYVVHATHSFSRYLLS